ncbi:c-type cytochrome [Pinibacter aurantiacus]|uniref:Cytochrome c n=1 Tax=Pinibacter aurantiacus TaxID=2851599 RepID=A0A9E2S794_9BACT|nr:cytochrome c [Pinibacter aurantiacus]MBV4356278.1 cytochrome c [Pinibacter aurantiacus]
MRKLTATFAIIFLLFTIITGFTSNVSGKELYLHNCATCHGETGDRGRFGAKDLTKSVLPDSAIILQMQNGRKIMPSFRKRLTSDEMQQIMQFVKTLRQN